MLNEFVLSLKTVTSITASAFSQARKKLKHTAFIELNEGIVSLYYQEPVFKRLYGLRILAIDGSIVTLPYSRAVAQVFGSRKIGNHLGKDLGEYSRALFVACYDVLNHIAVRAVLTKGNNYEVESAMEMLDVIQADDLLIFDRFYASYPFLTHLTGKSIHYLVRCSKQSFAAARKMFEADAPPSLIASIKIPVDYVKQLRSQGLPATLKTRLVRIVLPSGEVEVLATSLMDESLYPTALFAQLYNYRWGVETFFSKLKGRLCLENFTGKSVEAIKQDFWSTIFISNLETVMTEDVQEKINERLDKQLLPKKINKAVSFNAIKNLAFDILSLTTDLEEIIHRLTKLFVMNPIVFRDSRQVPRHKTSDTQSYNFQKRMKKHVF